MSIPKVSVVIPVYNAEPYMEKCVRSLFDQTLEGLEFIFVDDCTPDNSIEVMQRVLDEYPHRLPQVKVIHHETNQGVGQTRQDGIDAATGEYIIHCDPDDWVDIDYYESLLKIAIQNNSDVVVGSYIEESGNKTNIFKPKNFYSSKDLFHNISDGNFHTALWNKLIRRDLAMKFRIPAGVNCWEDMSIVVPIFLTSNRVSFIENSFYHYWKNNPISIVNSETEEKVESQIKATEVICDFISNTNLEVEYKDILFLQWRAKRGLLFNKSSNGNKKWRDTFPDSTKAVWRMDLPFKSKILSIIALMGLSSIFNKLFR